MSRTQRKLDKLFRQTVNGGAAAEIIWLDYVLMTINRNLIR